MGLGRAPPCLGAGDGPSYLSSCQLSVAADAQSTDLCRAGATSRYDERCAQLPWCAHSSSDVWRPLDQPLSTISTQVLVRSLPKLVHLSPPLSLPRSHHRSPTRIRDSRHGKSQIANSHRDFDEHALRLRPSALISFSHARAHSPL
jgi:hypothetical protein